MPISLIALALAFSTAAAADCTLQMKIDDTIGPATLDYFSRGMEISKSRGCSSFLLLINTPGGDLQTTRTLVEKILASEEPFLCVVAPSGGHAGSAGAILLQACHVAGALEATNIGAATPISGSGEKLPDDLRNKLINDTRSWVEGLAKLRGRNVSFAEKIVTEATAVAAFDAQKMKAIDIVAKDISGFLDKAKGRRVAGPEGREMTVSLSGVVPYEPDLRHDVLQILTDPQIVYFIFMGSLALLYFELTHPGVIAPGVAGAIGLVISLISFHRLDVWWGGLALLLLGIVFMVAEAYVPSFGALGLGGIVAFVLGSLFLFDPAKTGYSLPLAIILPTTICLGLLMFGLAWFAYGTRHIRKRGGFDDLMDHEGIIVSIDTKDTHHGFVEIQGETWQFTTSENPAIGDKVVVKSRDGFELVVEIKKE